LDSATSELDRTLNLNAYEGFEVAWVAVIKIANLLPGDSEHKRLIELLNLLPDKTIRSIFKSEDVDALLELKPPLETILNSPHERLNEKRTKRELNQVRQLRNTKPKTALKNLAEILKRVRNRRAHGFKTSKGPRDTEILQPSFRLVRSVGYAAAEAMKNNVASYSNIESK
jgi:hypothetical protein